MKAKEKAKRIDENKEMKKGLLSLMAYKREKLEVELKDIRAEIKLVSSARENLEKIK